MTIPSPQKGPTQKAPPQKAPPQKSRGRAASISIAIGILLSRIIGLVRERAIAVYFGAGMHADVLANGLRLPNVLQNLLGEGTLSASFIPVYSELLGQGRTKDAGRVAGAMFALLLGVAGVISLLGILLAPVLVTVFTPGFEGHQRELMISVVRIIFPMTGILVLSAWALGILNSHRNFFIPYFAPVLWNAAIIGTFVVFSGRVDLDRLLIAVAWGALVGGFLQFAIQLPWVLKLDREIRINTGRGLREFKEAVRNAIPAIMGRGVVQLSTYVDIALVTLLAAGGPVRLRFAQTLYVLPVSLFGMSIAAAELPELSRERGSATEALRERAVAAVRRVAFFVVPSLVAFLLLGNVIVAGIYQSGKFGHADVLAVWAMLAAYSLGLLPSTSTRIYQSAFFALRDTKTPARVATLRVIVAAIVGAVLMVQFEPITKEWISIPGGIFSNVKVEGVPLGPVGLALGSALGAWLEWALLRRSLKRQIGAVGTGASQLARMFGAALAGAVAGYSVRFAIPAAHPIIAAAAVAIVFAVVYFAVARMLGLEMARTVIDSALRRIRRR